MSNILSLPNELLHRILIDVCETSYADICRAKACCKTFGDVSDNHYFYKEIDIFVMQAPTIYHYRVASFKLLCLQHGNLSALFLRGSCEYFHRGNLVRGLTIICEAARGGYDIAKYAYANIQRIMFTEESIDLDLINLDKKLVYQMQIKVESINIYGYIYELPELFSQHRRLIPIDNFLKCQCGGYNSWREMFNDAFKTPGICESCFWMLQTLSFANEFPIRVLDWPN